MRDRGRISLMSRLCETCWNVFANEMAEADGATAAPRSEPDSQAVGVLSGAFTAVATMTTAYLGIKAVSNTAQEMSRGDLSATGAGSQPGTGSATGGQ